MAGCVVKQDPLAEVYRAIVERLPIHIKVQVMRQVHSDICLSRHGPECSTELAIMNPDFDIFAVEKQV